MKMANCPAFQFSTKAGNLAQLRGRLVTAKTVDLEVVFVGNWRAERDGEIERIQERFASQQLIVRSSAPGEDSAEASMAGAFDSILNVDCSDLVALGDAIDAVADSYASRRGDGIDSYEVLVQPMVVGVQASGVVFTRDLDKGGPYFLLNYDDESERTDTITGGYTTDHKVVRIFKEVDAEELSPILRSVVLSARELEGITGTDALDIEFAIDDQGELFVLQVRPLARTKIVSYQRLDQMITEEIRHAGEFVTEKCRRVPQLYGDTTVFGEMPDWNPAEIIGTQPKPLATTLYSFIIMKSVWREARHLGGYRHPFPYQLLVNIAGRPYVDVRCSFNSFLPATLRPELSEKLVNHYLDRLKLHPEFHDKIEFEIVISALDFDFENQTVRLREAGFSPDEIEEIRAALFALTDAIVSDRKGLLERLELDVDKLKSRREAILANRDRTDGIPMLVEQLLEDCIEFGTLPFSVFARCAFIANSFLKSMVHRGVMNDGELDKYLHSIDTVAGDFVTDLEKCKSGDLDLDDFLVSYGHLRPGTYDICAYTYAEKPETYLGVREGAGDPPSFRKMESADRSAPSFPPAVVDPLAKLIAEAGFTFDVEALNSFIIKSIQLREAIKFEFTKNLSAAMTLLVEFGGYHGFSREDLSFLPIESILALANQSISDTWITGARQIVEQHRKRYELTGSINLPDLIFTTKDLEVVSLQRRRPNFVTQGRLVASCTELNGSIQFDQIPDLSGRIILIENADPGFDWLFGRGIGGLITKHGGAASHMTIRCAELGLPAAIGCGEQIFEELRLATSIILDCAGRRVETNEV